MHCLLSLSQIERQLLQKNDWALSKLVAKLTLGFKVFPKVLDRARNESQIFLAEPRSATIRKYGSGALEEN